MRPEEHVAGQHRTPSCACFMVRVLMAIGDGRTYNTALLVFDADSLGPYAAQRGLDASPAALAADPGDARIAAGQPKGNINYRRSNRSAEVPHAHLWEPGGDEITGLDETLKRRQIAAKYSAEIEGSRQQLRPQVTTAVPSTQPA